MNLPRKWSRSCAALCWPLFFVLTACDLTLSEPPSVTPTFEPKSRVAQRSAEPLILGPLGRTGGGVKAGPTPPPGPRVRAAPSIGTPPLPAGAQAEALALEQVPLPAFIEEVFAKTLGLTVQLDQGVATRTDLVTLRTGRRLPAEELFDMGVKILAGYGLAASWDGSVLHVVPDAALMAQMPVLIRSRALPEMPTALRPIFQFVDLQQVSAADMISWLTNVYGAKIKAFASLKTNSILVFGLPQDVRATIEAVQVLDQARLAGRTSARFSPVYWTAQRLASKLTDILRAEGYDVSASSAAPTGQGSAIMLVPVEANNSMIAFAADARLLQHISKWVADLDQPGQSDPSRNIFVYLVQNTTAAGLGRTVQSVLGGQVGVSTAAPEAQLERAGATQTQATATPIQAAGQAAPQQQPAPPPPPSIEPPASAGQGGPRIVIDTPRNALVLIGTAQDYERVRPLLLALDKAARQALIEVTVVELDLNDSANLGINWSFLNHVGGGLSQSLGTGANVLSPFGNSSTGNNASSSAGVGLPLGTSGFNYTILNGIGEVRFLLNAFAQNNHISVLSTPRVLAESGGTARIEVGTEVPIVTSQGTTNTIQNAGTTGILQSIEYRKTGILLRVNPIIHSGNQVDLGVSQEVSQALPNSTPGITSPLIQNRNVSTQLSLTDGQTLVIGGLISENRSSDDAGVPYLKDIPGIGQLFRNQTVSKDRTELLVFITPYVISSDADANALTHQFQENLKGWKIPDATLRW